MQLDYASKEILYRLIRQFLNDELNVDDFCSNFSNIYNLEVDYNLLTGLERQKFKELAVLTSRFSPFEEDLKKYDCYFNEQQVRLKVMEVNHDLKTK